MTITESNNLVDFSVEDNCYVNDKFIGTTVAKKVTVNILNPNNEINLENKEIEVSTGMIINGIEQVVPFGNFIIEKPDNREVKEKTSFTGYDYMIKFNVLYKNRVKFPCKAKVLFQDICNQAGLIEGNIDFINCDYMILGNPFTNNEDCRTVLSNLAQLAGGFAKIGRDNKVYIKTLKNISNLLTVKYVNATTVKELNLTMIKTLSIGRDNADERIDGNNYFDDFSKNKQWGELNSLVLGLSNIEGENTALDDKDSIRKKGLTEITIQDNFFLTSQKEREKAIVPIWGNLKGLKYLPFKTKYYGYPYIDSGDMIYLYDTKGVGYISYVFNHTFIFNGGYSGNIETPSMTKTQTAYKNTFNLKTKFRITERRIDKINGEISDIIHETDENTEKISEHTQTIDEIKDTLKSVTTTVSKTVKEVKVMYALSSSSTEAPTSGWSVKAPVWQEGKYMWQKTVTTFSDDTQEESQATCIQGAKGQDGKDGANGEDGVNGTNGKDGLGIKSIETQYYLSNSETEVTGGTWKSTQDKWSKGKYIWTRSKITWSDNSVTYSESVVAEGLNSANENADSANEGTKEVTTKMNEVEKTVEGITQTVNKTTERLNNDYSTTEQMNSVIEQKAGEINLEVSDKLNNVQIGGTNLIPNSSPYDLEGWHVSNNANIELTLTDEEIAPYNKSLRIRTLAQPSIACGIYIIPTSKVLEESKEYCFSIWLKATAATNVTVGYARGGQTTFNVTTEWQKFSYKFTALAPTGASHGFAINVLAGTTAGRSVYVHSIKLEEGNKVTAWSPAPSDDVKGFEIISKINMSPEEIAISANKININGVISANGNFKVDTEGNLEANNAKFTGDIFLSSGKKVIGGDGMMTNLSFVSEGAYKGFDLLGYKYDYYYESSSAKSSYGEVTLDVYIPDNFVIKSASIQIQHSPVFWNGYDDKLDKDYSCWGYARNIKLYKATGNQNYEFNLTYMGEYNTSSTDLSVTEIPLVLGAGGWTPSIHSGAIYQIQGGRDISSVLEKGVQKLVFRCADGNLPNNVTDAALRTGVGRAYLNVIGYLA